MDINIYDEIYNSLEKYMAGNPIGLYGAALVHYPSTSPTYPYVVFDEVRNQSFGRSYGEVSDKVASLGYRVRVYGKTKGSASKMKIARSIVGMVDEFLTEYVGLKQVSSNPDPNIADGDLYGIVVMYETKYYENRKNIII